MKKKKNIFSFILIIIGILIFIFYKYDYFLDTNNNTRKVVNYFKNNLNIIDNIDSYYGLIEIPKLKLVRGFYGVHDSNNNVNKNIYNAYENITSENFVLVLASHSGNSNIAYFHNLNKIDYNDEIYIYYNNNEYLFKVSHIYEIEKNGNFVLEDQNNALYLITCCGDNKQMVVVAKLTFL